MKFLADAHVSVEMVAMLRDLGHDCLDASAIPPRMQDVDVLRMAAAGDRVVLTADKDFGELVFVHAIACPGVVLIRVALPREARGPAPSSAPHPRRQVSRPRHTARTLRGR